MIEIESIIAQIIKHKEDRDIFRDQYPSQIAAKLLEEASDVGLFLMAVFRLLEADMLEEFREKTVVNSLRYPASECQDGVWVQVYPKLKASQQPIKDEFYA